MQKNTTVVWTRRTDGGENTTKCSFTWTCGGKEKQRGQRKIWMENVMEDLEEKNTDLTSIVPIGNGQSNECYGQDITNCRMISRPNDQNTNYHGTRMTPIGRLN